MHILSFQKWFGGALVSITALAIVFVLNAEAAEAAKCPSLALNMVVRVSGSGKVNYLREGVRTPFISDEAALTWYPNLNKAKRVTASCLKDYDEVAIIGFRPGSRLVTVGPKKPIYAVGPENTLLEISTPAVGKALYGANWRSLAKRMKAKDMEFYTMGEALTEPVPHDGMLIKKKGDKGVYLVMGGELKMINGKLPAFLTRDARLVSVEVFESVPMGADTITAVDFTGDPLQGMTVEKPMGENDMTPGSDASLPSDQPSSSDKTDTTKLDTPSTYTGAYPAPEGVVLTGTIGENKFKEPTGSGAYRFRLQTEWARPTMCLDDTRVHLGSQGVTWEEGWKQGFNIGKADYDALPQLPYVETPHGDKAGNKLYDAGYRVGYKAGYNGGSSPLSYEKTCPRTDNDSARTDDDGWYMYDVPSGMPSLLTVYAPANPYAGLVTSPSKSALGAAAKRFSLTESKIMEVSYNSGKPALNISEIDFADGELDAAEAAMTTEKFAQALYDAIKNNYEKVLKTCKLGPASIATASYGGNSFTNLSYTVICPTGLDSGDRWNQVAYSFMKNKANKRMFQVYWNNGNNVRKSGTNEYDDTKLMSADFISQFLAKVKYE